MGGGKNYPGNEVTEMNVEGEKSKWREAKTGGQQMDINRFSRQYNHKYICITEKEFFSNDFLFLRKELLVKSSVRMMLT